MVAFLLWPLLLGQYLNKEKSAKLKVSLMNGLDVMEAKKQTNRKASLLLTKYSLMTRQSLTLTVRLMKLPCGLESLSDSPHLVVVAIETLPSWQSWYSGKREANLDEYITDLLSLYYHNGIDFDLRQRGREPANLELYLP